MSEPKKNQTQTQELQQLLQEMQAESADEGHKTRNVGIFIFDDVEVLDFAGPFEVFNVTGELNKPAPFNVFTVGLEEYPIEARGKLSITPDWSLETTPPLDILIIPGGRGTRPLMQNGELMDWLKEQAPKVERLLSVCTGALLLGKAGLLNKLDATTHHGAFDELRAISPNINVVEDKRYVDNGKIITAGGISAGIDMSLYVVRQLLGDTVLAKTLKEMEYEWTEENSQKYM